MSSSVAFAYFGLEETFKNESSTLETESGNNFRNYCIDANNVANAGATKMGPKNSKSCKDKRYQPFFNVPGKREPTIIDPRVGVGNLSHSNNHFCNFSKTIRHNSTVKTLTSSQVIVKTKEMKEFFKLTDDCVIQEFLTADSCKRIADKYLIAMIFAYFKRANFSLKEYNRVNFFLGLYLANDVEEDEEEQKYEIFPWVLGEKWRKKYSNFIRMRDGLLRRIGYKAIISRRCCDEIMAIEPDHDLWKRERPIHHGGAVRGYMKDPSDDGLPRGPKATPRICPDCDMTDSQYDSASPASTSWSISTGSGEPSSPEMQSMQPPCFDTRCSNFLMTDLQKSLAEAKNTEIWPATEE